MKNEIAEMDKCVMCLALEVPEIVHKDVVRIWQALKTKINQLEKIEPAFPDDVKS